MSSLHKTFAKCQASSSELKFGYNISMQTVVDGLPTNYQIVGSGPDDVVILPGWFRSSAEWLPFVDNLELNCRFIILDFPGFGATPKPKTDFGVEDYADFVEHFLQKIGVKHCVIIGHSFGGRIGIILATRRTLAKKLILIDAAGIEKKNLWLKLKLLLAKALKPIVPKSLVHHLLRGDYYQAGEMKKIFQKVISQDLELLLQHIKIPTLIVWGEKDRILPLSHARRLHKGIKGSQLRIVWGAAHHPHLEQPFATTSIITEFLDA